MPNETWLPASTPVSSKLFRGPPAEIDSDQTSYSVRSGTETGSSSAGSEATTFGFTRYSSNNSATNTAVGTDTSAPTTPAREAPRSSAISTASPDKPTLDFMMRGVSTEFSNWA